MIGNAITLAKGHNPIINKEVESIGLANPSDTKITSTLEGKSASVTGLGAIGVACSDAASQLAPFTEAVSIARWGFIALTMIGVGFGLYASIQRIKAGNV